jgi:hypothetical protein
MLVKRENSRVHTAFLKKKKQNLKKETKLIEEEKKERKL